MVAMSQADLNSEVESISPLSEADHLTSSSGEDEHALALDHTRS